MTPCPLTTEELRTRARYHRDAARGTVGYQSQRDKLARDEHYQKTQTLLAEVYEELIERRLNERP